MLLVQSEGRRTFEDSWRVDEFPVDREDEEPEKISSKENGCFALQANKRREGGQEDEGIRWGEGGGERRVEKKENRGMRNTSGKKYLAHLKIDDKKI